MSHAHTFTGLKPIERQAKWSDPNYSRTDLRQIEASFKLTAPEILPSAKTLEAAIEVMARTLGVNELVPSRVIATPVEDVTAQYGLLKHLVEKRGEDRERYANYLLPSLQNPFEVWRVAYENGEFRNRYVGVFHGAKDTLVSVQINLGGALLWNVMMGSPAGMNRQRIGELIYTKK
jgi:hypothetical protein